MQTLWERHRLSVLILFLTWGTYFTVLFARMVKLRPEGLWVGHPSVWSDWALHIGMANIFAFKPTGEWFDYHPIYAGGKFTYPFAANLVSGLLMRLGIPLPAAFIVPSILTVAVLLAGMYALLYLLLRSQKQALTAIFLFFLTAGMGFTRLLENPDFSSYTIANFSSYNQYDWYTGNFIDGMLLPQRAFLLGMAVGVWALAGLLYGLRSASRRRNLSLLGAGILAGLLPIIHVHTFIAVGFLSLIFALSQPISWRLAWYFGPFGALSLILYFIFIHGGIEAEGFFQWLPGWTNTAGLAGWIKQWWLQWGLMLPVAAGGLWLVWRQDRTRAVQLAGFVGLFVLANIILFQPVRWDNTKIFLWAYLGLAGLASIALAHLWHRKALFRAAAVALALGLTLTGWLEVARLQVIASQPYQLSTAEEIELGRTVRNETDAHARFLTSHRHNHWVSMWAVRPILMGYQPWVWNYGFDSAEREADIRAMYRGGPELNQLLQKYDVQYVVVGPDERQSLQANEQVFAERFSVAFATENYRVYDTRSLTLQPEPTEN